MFDIRTVFIDKGSDESILKSMYDDQSGKYNSEELSKAMNRAGLVQKEVTVHGKHGTYTQMKWVKASKDNKKSEKRRTIGPKVTEEYRKTASHDFKQGTVVEVRPDGNKSKRYLGVILSVSVGTDSTIHAKIKDSNSKIHTVSRGWVNKDQFEPVSKSSAEKFLDRKLFDKEYFPSGSNSSKSLSEDDVLREYHKDAPEGIEFDDFVKSKFFISDGYTQTNNFYKDSDGNYSPERQELHDAIVSEIVESCDLPPKGSKPVCFLYGGGSASGKSSTADKMRDSFIDKTGISVGKVDSDEIKKSIPEYKSFQEQNVKTAALRVHNESSDIANQAIDACIAEGRCFAFDGTMKSLNKYSGIVNQLRESGYHIVAVGTDIPTEEAIRRSGERAKKSGRDVPESIIRGSHGGFAATFPKIMENVDEYYLYDNSQPEGEPPTLICSTGGVHNQSRWDEFLEKGNDYLKSKGVK